MSEGAGEVADESRGRWRSNGEDPAARILSREALKSEFATPRSETVVFSNGVFDLLHRGHILTLTAARQLGDRLIVGINSDASARAAKGGGRPLQSARDRAFVVAALRCVDAVTIFEEQTPVELIRALLPDVLAKGGDYLPEQVVGGELVRAYGGEVRILSLVEDRSTSGLILRARGLDDGPAGR